jgi:hypothetical protein
MANVISDIAMSISMAAAAVNERRLLDAAAVKARASLILPQRFSNAIGGMCRLIADGAS